MNVKKNIQIFYGGFRFVKGGVNSHSHSLKNELAVIILCMYISVLLSLCMKDKINVT
jgi:hypothetical protein